MQLPKNRSEDDDWSSQFEIEFGEKGNRIMPFITDADILRHYSREFKDAVGLFAMCDIRSKISWSTIHIQRLN